MAMAGFPIMEVTRQGAFEALHAQGLRLPLLSQSETGGIVSGKGGVIDLSSSGVYDAQPLCCYFPLVEGYGTSLLGNPNDTPLTVNAATMWGSERGLNFNGSSRGYVSIAAAQGMLRTMLNLDSLTSDEQITVYGVLKHPTANPAAAATVFYWGADGGTNPEGWGMQIASNGKFRWRQRALGASAAQTLNLNLNAVTDSGVANTNSHTAFAFGISATDTNELEIQAVLLHLAVPGTFTQVNRTACHTIPRLHNGATRSPRWSATASLTLGAYPNNTESNLSDIMPASWALQLIEFQRGPRDPGKLRRLVRDLAVSPFTRPASAAEQE